jgi:hypothetical protein
MPRYDGTGPRGQGPLSGRGEGYCAIRLPKPRSEGVPYGYVGRAQVPVHLGLRQGLSLGRALGQGRRRGRGGLRLLGRPRSERS